MCAFVIITKQTRATVCIKQTDRQTEESYKMWAFTAVCIIKGINVYTLYYGRKKRERF